MNGELDWLIYDYKTIQNENDRLVAKLADIRDLFDESDMEAESHGMEDMVADPFAVACYAESKLKRLIEENKQMKECMETIQEVVGFKL